MRKYLLAAAAASVMSTAAVAADMPIAPPPAYGPPPVEDFGGWYLRGDIGMTNQSVKTLDSNAIGSVISSTGIGFDSGMLVGVGVGYQFNNWIRADITGQYRGRANFHGSQTVLYDNGLGPAYRADNYSGSKSEALFLANAYVDLGTWWCVTPFIGAGVGASYNRIVGFRDDGIGNQFGAPLPVSVTNFADAGKWNFAWAAHAGVGYKVSPSLTLELAYSYVDLGSAAPGNFTAFDLGATGPSSIKFKDITSHDVKFGLRWNLDPAPVYAPPALPLIRKG
jgi:opacity protein-like surface antigen